MDWYIFLTPLLLVPIIFLFRLVGCGLDTSGDPGPPGDGDDGDDGGPERQATYDFYGPNEGETGVESAPFTVSLFPEQMITAPLKVTPHDDGPGEKGTFDKENVVLNTDSTDSRSATFRYTPVSDGDH